jgi:glycosyltransferase involved in cell wall biosynthesis
LISVCIPVYNFDVSDLIESLIAQGEKLDVPFEIIAIDDCSSEHFKMKNAVACSKVKYIQLEGNIGRSKIRNLFLDYVSFENLLFLDCDSYIIQNSFLENYINKILKTNYKVVFGGRIYPEKCPSKNQKLSWEYGSKIESKNAEIRKKTPNKSFMTNNFLIKKDVLNKIKFDEKLTRYGHEDTLFGFELMLNSIEINHIENPILNGEIETNDVYLSKTEEGILNLSFILKNISNQEKFIQNVSLLDYYSKIKKKKLLWLFKFLFFFSENTIRMMLRKGIVNLKVFNFYKLGFFIKNHVE